MDFKNLLRFYIIKKPYFKGTIRIKETSIFLLFICSFQLVAGNLDAQTVSIKLETNELSVRQLISDIEDQTDFLVLFRNNDIDVERIVRLKSTTGNLIAFLDETFHDTGISYKFQNKYIVLSKQSYAGKATGIFQQSGKRITGLVTDTDGEPIIGANIIEKGAANGTATDTDGRFSLTVADNAVLQVSFIGYVSRDIGIRNQSNLQITLEEDNLALEEIVVVGYGTQKKVNLTGAVQNISGNELIKRQASNTSVALQGLVAGVSVVQSSGQPGADAASIIVHGTGSLNSSTGPLVLIDGIAGDMNQIDMNAIESISILKDAASASIYGSRASNGVILITTKRSKDEKVSLSYSGYAGFNTPTELPDPVSAIGYMEAINIARANSDMDPQYTQGQIDEYKTSGPDNYYRYDTNWRDEVIKKTAPVQNHSISLSGGSKKLNYFAHAGYLSQGGQIPNNDYSRMTLRINTDIHITDWLKAGLDINIRQSNDKRPSQQSPSSIFNLAIVTVPLFAGINNDGTW
ncbi:MAG: SusC/RagA family TonB-linked outer membrane protein, partial [Tannerella sp.]|nr:SusC/RagA family TonB-linked outer membrane protein [Tannerella sp.]